MPAPVKRLGRLIALLAVVATVALLDRPRSALPVHQAEWLTAGDARVRTIRAGTGDTTLLLIHGFGESLFTWRAILDPLATGYRVVAFDLPGFAGSSKPAAAYTLEAMTSRVSDFVDRWTRGPVIVVGHSMGGEIAASLAIAKPERIVAAVLLAPAGWGVSLGGITDTMYPEKARLLAWYLSGRAFALPEHDPEWLGEPDSAAAHTLVTDSLYRRSTAAVLQEFDFRALREQFAKISQPVLLIWGTLDPVIPYFLADSLAGAIPCATLQSLSGALHRPQVELPDTVTSLIKGFAARPAC